MVRGQSVAVVTGSQSNVRSAYSSGTPAIGVGAGNVPVIIDETADRGAAAEKICASKTFDNATSCSSENSLIILDEVYDEAIQALQAIGGYLADAGEKDLIEEKHWVDDRINRNVLGKDAAVLARAVGLSEAAGQSKFFLVEENGTGPDHPLSDEKL